MDNAASKHEGRGLSAKALIWGCLVAVIVIGGVEWRVLSQLGLRGGREIAAQWSSLFGLGRRVGISRAAVLDIIPSAGKSLAVRRVLLLDNVAAAAMAIQIPLADPLFVARSVTSPDQRLVEWLDNWRMNLVAGKLPTAVDQERLLDILDTTPLSWQSLFRIGKAYRDVSGDALTASRFYTAAVTRADRELQQYEPGASAARPILMAMNDSRRLLWEVADNIQTNDRRCVEALELVFVELKRRVVPGDPTLGDAREHAIIGVPECIYLLGHADQALPLLMALDTSGMTDNEKLGVAWIRGLALYQTRHFETAARQFHIVAQDGSYQYAQDAAVRCVQCLCQQGATETAVVVADDCKQRFRPDFSYLADIAIALDSSRLKARDMFVTFP
jgi:hypothetical protein